MINSVTLIGRLTKDPQMGVAGEHKVLNFTLAVQRDKENADFIRCTAWDKTAELIAQYTHKGSQLGVSGKLQARTYQYPNDPSKKVYTMDVRVNDIMFLDGKREEEQKPELPTLEITGDDLPF